MALIGAAMLITPIERARYRAISPKPPHTPAASEFQRFAPVGSDWPRISRTTVPAISDAICAIAATFRTGLDLLR